MKPAPIVLFVYKRPWHTGQTLKSLAANNLSSESELIIYADGPKANATKKDLEDVKQVHEIIHSQRWPKKITIHTSKENTGLAASVIRGVSETLALHDSAIILEDDMILSPHFLEFMNEGLKKYEHTEEVISIHGYCVPINYAGPTFFLRGADCWGWATWRRGWKYFNPDGAYLMEQLKQSRLLYDFDFNGSYDYSGMLKQQITGAIDSWAIRWYASAYLNNKLTLYPTHSLVQNIGGDGSGTHEQNAEQYQIVLSSQKIKLPDIAVEESQIAKNLIGAYHYKYLTKKNKLRKFLKWGY